MKKFKMLMIIFCFVFVSFVSFMIGILIDDSDYSYTKNEKKKSSNFSNRISLMLETGSGTGVYEKSTSGGWPTEGYLFNKTLSRCENGGELEWDNVSKKVLMSGNVSDKCYVYFDAYLLAVIDDIELSPTATSISVSVDVTPGTTNVVNYMYSINDGKYVEADSNLYTFRNLTGLTTYNIKVYVVDENGKSSIVSSKSISTKAPTLEDVTSSGTNLASAIKAFAEWGTDVTNIYIHNSSLTTGANDGSYRYAGANPNNYVCFGSTASTCPNDNLYRIIGVFGSQVKLIKADAANSNLLGEDGAYNEETSSASDFSDYNGYLTIINRYHWNNDTNKNVWSESNLNTINLNTNFLTSLGNSWISKISLSSWETGGNANTKLSATAMNEVYVNEIVSPSSSVKVSSKIGLMYISDYGYAASPTYWTYPAYNVTGGPTADYRAAVNENWMYLGISEWTITRSTGISTMAFHVYNPGYLTAVAVNISHVALRPTFYLNSTITYVSGAGSYSNPVRLS